MLNAEPRRCQRCGKEHTNYGYRVVIFHLPDETRHQSLRVCSPCKELVERVLNGVVEVGH